MKVLKQLDREGLLEKYRYSRDFNPHIKSCVTKYRNHSLVSLELGEFKKLLFHSSPRSHSPTRAEFPLMGEVIEEIKKEQAFLKVRPKQGLSGKKVKEYLEQFRKGVELVDCFIREKDPDMRAEGMFYICDGMHRLAAYGLFSDLQEKYFPIEAILATEKI